MKTTTATSVAKPSPGGISDVAGTKPSHRRIVKASAYSVASILAVLMLTATFPPLLADQSDRAVVDAPITLVTAPIAGEVTQVYNSVGDHVGSDTGIAEIHNGRLDRATLITLQSRTDETRTSLAATRQKKDSDKSYISMLNAEISKQVAQTLTRLQGEVAEARARLSASNAEEQSTKAVVDRQQDLVNRNAASLDLLRPTQFKLSAAQYDKAVEAAKLDQKLAAYEAVKQGTFVGNDFNSLAVLAQKQRDLSIDAQRLEIEERQLAASLESQETLLAQESNRLSMLSDASLTATRAGYILNLGVAPGRHVSPGDAVATMIDCDKAFVVGIFSYRQAQSLAVGTQVRVSSEANEVARLGRVTEILPKTSDKTDQQYAVPFPQTERREMYVLVSLDPDTASDSDRPAKDVSRISPCSVGQWVTVTREGGWVPSASVMWKAAAAGFTGQNAQAVLRTVASGATKIVSALQDMVLGHSNAAQLRASRTIPVNEVWGDLELPAAWIRERGTSHPDGSRPATAPIDRGSAT